MALQEGKTYFLVGKNSNAHTKISKILMELDCNNCFTVVKDCSSTFDNNRYNLRNEKSKKIIDYCGRMKSLNGIELPYYEFEWL